MGWQKTFNLLRRSKGCHLVADDVLAQISEGIKDVKIQPLGMGRVQVVFPIALQIGMLFLFMWVKIAWSRARTR